MKKVMIIVAILGIGIISKAQTFSIGPTGGYGHSWITNANGDTKFNPAWNAGIAAVYSTSTHFGIGADIKYSAEGNKVKDLKGVADGAENVRSTVNANYVRVPVKAIYFFGDNNSTVRPKVYAGPSFGFLTGGKTVTNSNGVVTKTDADNDIKNFDFGATAGAGLNFKVAPRTWLNTDVAFYQGLTDITKANNVTQRNGNIGVNVGLLVGLGK
ncbi:MAG TPA: porin family protein [Parafilimonas sp.]|nr:porin family protein [Parafilimonas sp.]